MEKPLTYLKQRADDNWLIGFNSREFAQLSEQLFLELTQLLHQGTLPKILLAHQDPVQFLAGFIAACAAGCPVFLCNPNWVEAEWQQVFDLVQPDLIWGQVANTEISISPSPHLPISQSGLIMIPTGGSSGKIRFAIHTWETLMSSVRGFQEYFNIKTINSFCVLPLYHVSGLMQFMRSFTTGGRLVIIPFKELKNFKNLDIDISEFFISLVPTQLQQLLPQNILDIKNEPFWLSQFQTVLLGGSPAWTELLEQARNYSIRLAPTYGMTETASQIATLKPEDFLDGNNSCGQILPHANVTIRHANDEILELNQIGNITIQSTSLLLGYYPHLFSKEQTFKVDDLGFFTESGYLNIVGRSSNKIITGGENVFPSEVEAAIKSTNLVTDVCVIGLPDDYWGQVVTAVYVPVSLSVTPKLLEVAIKNKLSKFKQPKSWVEIANLPRNYQGKINIIKIQEIAKEWLHQHSNDLAI